MGNYTSLPFLKLQSRNGDRGITYHMTASPCHRLDAMKSFERVLGRVTKVIQGSCDGWKHLAGIRTKCKWQKGPCHWLWSGYHVAFSFLPATQLGVFLFPHSRFALVEVWVAACYPTLLWGLLVIFPSLQRYQQWFQWKDQCCLSNAAEGTEGSNLTAGMRVPTKSVS